MLDGKNRSNIVLTSAFSNLKWIGFVTLFMVTMASIVISPAVAAPKEEGYAKLTESEVSRVDTLSSIHENQPGNISANNGAIKEAFEKSLKFELPTTYKFYLKLRPEDQDKVLAVYNREKKISTTSKLIFNLYFNNTKNN
jgi:hypothetical protein